MTQQQPTNTPSSRRILIPAIVILFLIAAAFFLIYRYLPAAIQPILPPTAVGAPTAAISGPAARVVIPSRGGNYTMKVVLSEGQPQPAALQPITVLTGDPLPDPLVQQLLSRLPALPTAEGDQQTFNRPVESLPQPIPGNIIPQPFPPLEVSPTPEQAHSGPLKVLRYSPEGEIPIAPFVSITFDQPMVPLGTLKDLAEADVPVRIQPALPGTWRWLGTRTLTFQADSKLIDRLPKATQYHVSIPAGTKSTTGSVLPQEVSWDFSVPAPKMTVYSPAGGPAALQPLFFIAFDQRIDPASVLGTIRVDAGGQNSSLQLAAQDEIDKDANINRMVKNTLEGRFLVFKAARPFPASTHITVTVGPGTPSAEGPLLTTEAQTFEFDTYSPLQITDHRCSWGNDTCPPLTPFYIQFNNPLDENQFSEDMLTVSPAIPGMTVNLFGNSLEIHGQTVGRTTYTVTVSRRIADIYIQTLGSDANLTFKVGSAESVLSGPSQAIVTLDPSSSKPLYSVYAINYSKLKLKVYRVQPADWPAYKEYLRNFRQTDVTPKMPGTLLAEKTLSLNLPADTLTQVDVDLSDYMNGAYGQFVLQVEPPKPLIETNDRRWQRLSQTVLTWVQVTQIGLDAFSDNQSLLAWATRLTDGIPLQGVIISTNKDSSSYQTAADGTITFPVPFGASYIVGSLGNDLAILPNSPTAWDDQTWTAYPKNDELRWYVMDDRQMYKPGEDVHIKGWIRLLGGGQKGDVSLVNEGLTAVNYTINDPLGNKLGDGRALVNSLGGFDLTFNIPKNSNLGNAQVYFAAEGGLSSLSNSQYYHNFQVQEFRRPEFEVTARNESAGPYYTGGQAVLAVDAKYYAGGALPNADVTWQVTSIPTNYSPPNWPDYTFGTWHPWWVFDFWGGGPSDGGGEPVTYTGKTDSNGTHYLNLNFEQTGDAKTDPRPQSVNASASVMDVNRQAWSSSTSLLVHPASVYIGMKSERTFVEQGNPLKIEYIVTDLDGKPAPGMQLTISAARMEWKYRKGTWAEVEAAVQTCSQVSTAEAGSCLFETSLGGSYQVTAQVTDSLGRPNQTRFTRWVSGGKQQPSRKVELEKVTLIPDKQTYQPGDTARILVQSPFTPAEGLLTVSRSGILYTTRFRMDSASTTLEVPILDAHIPNLEIQVDLVGSAARTSDDGLTELPNVPPRPAYASGTLHISIPPLQRTLALSVTPDQSNLTPGGETTLSLVLKDAAGQPMADAELAVVVVDEAILALTNYQLTDPLNVFYTDRSSDFSGIYGRANVLLLDPNALAQQAANMPVSQDAMRSYAGAPMGTAAPMMEAMAPAPSAKAEGGAQAAIAVRTDFNPLALFNPGVLTGADGTARISVHVPDNLTRYRVMVVAVDPLGKRFGSGESSITARLPLMVRPSAPRFLNFGDQLELPVVIQNQTDSAMDVTVAARAANLELISSSMQISVPANDRVEVRFPARTVSAGTARVQIAAASGNYADAAVIELPVYTPATSEAFATYGVIDNGTTAQPVQYPTGVFPQYGGLEISTSSTAVQALTDAVLYLVKYPYECSEQLASRILAVASLRDVLTAFKSADLPSPETLRAGVEQDIQRLAGMQNYDGGFGTWVRGFDSNPFNTVHVAHALARAGQKGYVVPSDMQNNVLSYLQQIETHYPDWYSQWLRHNLSAYALYVRAQLNDRDPGKALALFNEAGLDGLTLEGVGWLWPVLDDKTSVDALKRYVANRVVETAGAANFTSNYDEQNYLLLGSDRRADAILLDDLISLDGTSDLIPKLVNGLLSHRNKGRWDNTQENVFVLLALDHYFNTFETQTPDFVARIWLGSTYAGSNEFRGRSTDQFQTKIPMTYVLSETGAPGGTQNLLLSKEGPGRLYYRLSLRYAPTDLKLLPLDMGFVVGRTYEAVDDPADVTRAEDGSWLIKAGARVRVKVSMVSDNRRYHVALVDPLPAGLEIINPALAVSGLVPQNPSSPGFKYGWWWWGTWYEHQNLRDDRAEAFTSLLWDGVYDYSYVARATTPGTFVVPPAKAEEMYSPEVFGRSGSDVVIIK